jgi:hypothetical protein
MGVTQILVRPVETGSSLVELLTVSSQWGTQIFVRPVETGSSPVELRTVTSQRGTYVLVRPVETGSSPVELLTVSSQRGTQILVRPVETGSSPVELLTVTSQRGTQVLVRPVETGSSPIMDGGNTDAIELAYLALWSTNQHAAMLVSAVSTEVRSERTSVDTPVRKRTLLCFLSTRQYTQLKCGAGGVVGQKEHSVSVPHTPTRTHAINRHRTYFSTWLLLSGLKAWN